MDPRPVRRKKALRARTPLQRKKALKRSGMTQLRPASTKRIEGIVRGDWLRAVIERTAPVVRVDGRKLRVCPVCGQAPVPPHRLEGHHVIGRERLRRYVEGLGLARKDARVLLAQLVWDVRDGLACCTTCHDLHTRAARRIPRSKLLPCHFEFAAELDLAYVIDRYYPAA